MSGVSESEKSSDLEKKKYNKTWDLLLGESLTGVGAAGLEKMGKTTDEISSRSTFHFFNDFWASLQENSQNNF